MVKRIMARAAAAAAVSAVLLFLVSCTDILTNSIFPSYLPSLDKITDFSDQVPPGASYKDNYDIWLRTVKTVSGRRYLVVGLDFWDDVRDTVLIFSGDLKLHRTINSAEIYGGATYGAARFAAPAPDDERILIGFPGAPDTLVAVDPYSEGVGSYQTYSDSLNIVGNYGYENSFNFALAGSTWFVNGGGNNLNYTELTSLYAAANGSRIIFLGGLLNTGGDLLGAINPDGASATVFVRGWYEGKGFIASAATPAALPATLFSSDLTPIPYIQNFGWESTFLTRNGIVVAGWGEDWKIYKPNGSTVTGPRDEDREDLRWTFAPEGDAYYLVDGKKSQLVKARTWW